MPLRFATRSGELIVHDEPEGGLRMDFPADPPWPIAAPDTLADALGFGGATELDVLRGEKGWVVRVESEQAVRAASPDFSALRAIDTGPLAVVLAVTAPAAADGVDFVSRVFAPWAGVDEDPVTGVAHTSLGPYWAAVLGRDEMEARQISDRGGDLRVRVAGDRVHLIGHAVTVVWGEIELGEDTEPM